MWLGDIDGPKPYEFVGSGGFYFENTGKDFDLNFSAPPRAGERASILYGVLYDLAAAFMRSHLMHMGSYTYGPEVGSP